MGHCFPPLVIAKHRRRCPSIARPLRLNKRAAGDRIAAINPAAPTSTDLCCCGAMVSGTKPCDLIGCRKHFLCDFQEFDEFIVSLCPKF